MLWFLIPFGCLVAFYGTGRIAYARRMRRRERAMTLRELKDFARIAGDPAHAAELAFTGPHRDDQDRAYDTMLTARHVHRQLSLILDTSRHRVRWWALVEWFAPTGERSARFEATFIEGAIPSDAIRCLLKAARGEPQAAPAAEAPAPEAPSRTAPSDLPPDPAVDPFDTFDPTAQA